MAVHFRRTVRRMLSRSARIHLLLVSILLLAGCSTPVATPSVVSQPVQTPTPAQSPAASATVTESLLPASTPTAVSMVILTATPAGPTATPWPILPPVTPSPTSPTSPAVPTETVSPHGFVPILMYHHVALPNPNDDAIRRGLTVSPQQLDEELAWLSANHYHSVSLEQLFHHLVNGGPMAPHSVILTFDDGYHDNFSNAYPLLQKYGFQATFFIITDLVGAPDYMTWDQIRELQSSGHTIGAHTLTHPSLPLVTNQEAWRQISQSKQRLEAMLGHRVLFFDYPSGEFTPAIEAQVKQAGYAGAVSTIHGNVNSFDTLYELRRIRILPGIDLKYFAAPLQTPYTNIH